MDSRDINNHDMSLGTKRGYTCEQFVNIISGRTLPTNDPFWFDYSWQGEQAYKTGIYSEHKARWVAWHQHYWNYYKESVGFCDWGYSQLFSAAHPEGKGHTPEAEPRFLKAITGRNHSFEDGLEIGRRSWNLKRAIFHMQGRDRKMEQFTGYYYRPGASYCGFAAELPVFDGNNGRGKTARSFILPAKGSSSGRLTSTTSRAGTSKPATSSARRSKIWA